MKKKMGALTAALSLVLLLAACGGAPGREDGAARKDVDLSAFYEEQTQGDSWPSMMLAEDEMLDGLFPGLSGIETKQCIVGMAQISAAVGEIALVEVENAGDVEAVEEIFQERIDYQVGDSANPGGAWYPESIEGWKNDSRIVSNGNCVMLAVRSNPDEVVDAFNALFE